MLPIALILLVVISILGIMAMRNATVGEQTINAVRTNAATRAAAEMGLRHCEAVVYESFRTSSHARPPIARS